MSFRWLNFSLPVKVIVSIMLSIPFSSYLQIFFILLNYLFFKKMNSEFSITRKTNCVRRSVSWEAIWTCCEKVLKFLLLLFWFFLIRALLMCFSIFVSCIISIWFSWFPWSSWRCMFFTFLSLFKGLEILFLSWLVLVHCAHLN